MDDIVDLAKTTGGICLLLLLLLFELEVTEDIEKVSGPGEIGGEREDEVVELAEDAEADRSVPEYDCFLCLLIVTVTGD